MAIDFKIIETRDILKLKASGIDDNLEQVIEYGMKVIEAAKKYNVTKVLCDEQDLIYNLNTLDNFESAKYIAEQVPGVGKLAIVLNPQNFKDAEFWETVAVNRFLTMKLCKTIEEAERWLSA